MNISDIKIKIFLDSADLKEIEQNKHLIIGCTCNPTLMRKAGVRDYKEFAKQVLKMIPDMPISFEVFSDDLDTMKKEAKIISGWGENVYVKIPVTNTLRISTAPIIKELSSEGIKVNVTAILTTSQVQDAMKALDKNTPSIISVFVGRIADTGRDPIKDMRFNAVIVKRKPNIELLWASTRELLNIIQAQECGCHIITVTNDILKKLPMLGKDLNELSLETVKMFREDAEKSGYKILDE